MLTAENIDELIALKEAAQDAADRLWSGPRRDSTFFKNMRAENYAREALSEELTNLSRETVCTLQAMREALATIADGNVPRERTKIYRNDGAPSKYDSCSHDCRMWEDCGECISEFARKALGGG